jgi:UMF1 family MFS transporter
VLDRGDHKIGIVIGMAVFGFIDQITGSMRNSILFLITFFIIGVVLLLRVPNNQKTYSSLNQKQP